MRLTKKIIYPMVFITLLYYICLRLYCMPSLDKYTQYEQNIVNFCETGEGFIELSEAGTILADPAGKANSSEFSYYLDNNIVKQVYINTSVVCIVTWTEEPTYLIYTIK